MVQLAFTEVTVIYTSHRCWHYCAMF